LEEGFDRHARDHGSAIELSDFVVGKSEASLVVGNPGFRVAHEVGRDGDDLRFELRRRAPVEAREPNDGILRRHELIDVGGRYPGLYHEHVFAGHDEHEVLAGRYHTTDGVDVQLMHETRTRGSDFNPPELFFRRHLFLGELRHLGSNGLKLAHDLGPHLFVDLETLDVALRDGLPGTGDLRDEATPFARETGLIAPPGQ
jgi:hypothetical protein